MFDKLLITGGTGSFGTAFVKKVIDSNLSHEVIVYSRDELKQFEMQQKFTSAKIKYVLGDVRDFIRLRQSLEGVDAVIHAAAMKQIPASENNPIEAIKTNIIGADNIVNACNQAGVAKVIALSTDKAANPVNLYGATKLCSDKLIVAGNYVIENRGTKMSVVRYGNVLGSRGSVIPFFKLKSQEGIIPITDPNMTRFWISINSGVDFVLKSLEIMQGGEIFVPKIPSFKVIDVAKVVAPGIETQIVGIRPGEKLHEVMITEYDSLNTKEFDSFYVILSPELKKSNFYEINGKRVEVGFSYSSNTNKDWHSLESFKSTLIENDLL